MKSGISISPRLVFRALVISIAVLVTVSALEEIAKYKIGVTQANRYYFMATTRLFYVDSESSLATLFSTLQLAAAATLLGVIAYQNRRMGGQQTGRWTLLAVIFAGLTIDEACSVHEMAIRGLSGLRTYFTSGYFHYSWVVLGIGFVIIFALYYLPFLFRIPRKTARDFMIGGAIFVCGALGMEMLGGNHTQQFGRNNLGFVALSSIEETLEMLGIAIFVKALLQYLQAHHSVLTYHVTEEGTSSSSTVPAASALNPPADAKA